MKNIKYILLILTITLFTSCEEVIDVDLANGTPRLVVDASINWARGTDGSEQKVKLTMSGSYYGTPVQVVCDDTVFITNGANTVFNFTETPGTGEYVCTDFVPEIGQTYTLTVIHDGQTYTATEKLYATPQIDNIVQDNEGGFTGEDIELTYYFPDN
ncbi:DUF4249 family protein, partial [Flavobacterium sp.]|uniref:DUF4249 family protein n=1 Tax=Flavobacterium sp. TaxID=239 RepID=UPI0040341E55